MGLGSGINAFRARAERNGAVGGGGGAVGGAGTGMSGPWEAEKKKKKIATGLRNKAAAVYARL